MYLRKLHPFGLVQKVLWPWPFKQGLSLKKEIIIAWKMRLPLKIPYIETGCILSLPLLPTMSTCLAKSLRAAIFPPCKIILFCILMFSFKFGWTGYMKIFIQLSPGNGTFFFLNLVGWVIWRTLYSWAQEMELFFIKVFRGLLYTCKRQDFRPVGQRKDNALIFSKELADSLPSRNLFPLNKSE